nr:AAA family ATPase [Nocardioides sp. zg-1230]
MAEALARPRPDETPHRIEGFHEVGHSTTITARFKTGKTTLGGNMLRSLADGDDFLGRYSVIKPSGRIGLLNYELTDSDMLDWLEDQGIRKRKRIALLNLRGVPFSLVGTRNQEELIKWCSEMDVEVLHLDPHRRAFKGFGSENSNDDVNAFTDVLDVIKEESGVKDLFLYVHTGRSEQGFGEERSRGATALDDWADNRMILAKDEHQDRFLYMEGRTGSGYVPEFKLEYDRSTRRLTGADGNRRTNGIDKWKPEILNALATVEGKGAIVGDLEKRLNVTKKGGLSGALSSLESEGLIVRKKIGPSTRQWLKEHAPKEES